MALLGMKEIAMLLQSLVSKPRLEIPDESKVTLSKLARGIPRQMVHAMKLAWKRTSPLVVVP